MADARPGVAAQFEVEVVASEIAYRPRRQLVARVRDAGGALSLRFLNFYPSQQKVLQPGARLRIFGEVHEGYLGPEIIHPRFHVVVAGEPLPEGLTPVYPTTAGLGQATLRRLIGKALARVDLTDTLPPELLQRLDLPDFGAAIRFLHTPPPDMALAALEARDHPAWRRMQFDELLAQQLSLRRAYTARRARGAPPLVATATLTSALLAALPFRLTRAQQRAWQEIAADLGQPHPMQRLLQGDVGSGKTVVAALAMLHAVEAGHQAALMAPTEILAEQHYRKLAAWLEPAGHRSRLAHRQPEEAREASRDCKSRRRRDADCCRHPCPDRRQGRVRPPRPGHRRRAAPLRRPPAPGAEGEGAVCAPAGDVGDADPAHPGHELLRRPRCLGARRTAAGAQPGHHQAGFGSAPRPDRGAGARRLSRRASGLLGLPAHRRERNAAVEDRRRDLRAAHCRPARPEDRPGAWPAQDGGQGRGDGRLRRQRDPCAGGDHGDRGRRRCAQCQPDGDRTRRALRPRATAPVARPRRPRRRRNRPASCSMRSRWANWRGRG